MLQNGIIDFQSSLLEQELVWNNIENSFLVEKVNVILMEEEDGAGKTSFGQKIKQTAAKIGEWFRDMMKNLKGHFTKMFEAISNKVKKLKSKSSTATDDNVIEVDFINLAVIEKQIANAEKGGESSEEVPTKKVRFKGIKSLINAVLDAVGKLFSRAKNLFSKSNSECSKGASEAKKAESTGDQGALSQAKETKKRVSIFARALSFIFRTISRAFQTIATHHNKKIGKATRDYIDNKIEPEKFEKRVDKHSEKGANASMKASRYAQKADKLLKKEYTDIDSLLMEEDEYSLYEKCNKKSPEPDEIDEDSEVLDEEFEEMDLGLEEEFELFDDEF